VTKPIRQNQRPTRLLDSVDAFVRFAPALEVALFAEVVIALYGHAFFGLSNRVGWFGLAMFVVFMALVVVVSHLREWAEGQRTRGEFTSTEMAVGAIIVVGVVAGTITAVCVRVAVRVVSREAGLLVRTIKGE